MIGVMLAGLGVLAGGNGCRSSPPPEESPALPFPPKTGQTLPRPHLSEKKPPRPTPVLGQMISSADGSVSLALPQGWKQGEAASPVLLKIEQGPTGSGFTPSLFVFSTRVPGLSGDPPLDEIESALQTTLPKQSGEQNLKIVSTGRLRLGNREAIAIVATLTLAGTPVQQKQYFLYVGDRQYVLTGLAPVDRYKKLESLFDGIAASLKIR